MRTRPAGQISVIAALLATGACASRQHYPATWPTLIAADARCHQFSGRYGATPFDQAASASLSELLFSKRFNRAESVMFSFPAEGRLQIDVESSDGGLSSFSLRENQFACRNGVLIVRAAGEWNVSGGEMGFAVGHTTAKLEMHLAPDALVVQRKARTIGMIVSLPVTRGDGSWHRFHRLP